MKTRIFSFALVLVMLLSLASFASAEDPIVLNVVTNDSANNAPLSLDVDFVHNKILENTNVDVQLVHLDEYETSLGVRLSDASTTPDMFIITEKMLQSYAQMGLLLNLTPYKETGLKPVYDALGDPSEIENPTMYYEGDLYVIPATKAISQRYALIMVRDDWNKKFNLEVPTTIDELFDYCKTLSELDPDGNGVKDTVGLTAWGLDGLSVITGAYDVVLGNYVLIRDGVVTNTVLQPRMKEALEAVKKFYDAGLLDPDMLTSNSLVKTTFLACNVAVAAVPWSNTLKASYVAQYKSICPEANYVWIDAFSDGVNEDPAYYPLDHWTYAGAKYAISSLLEDEPEKLEAVWKVLEYMASEEGQMLVYFGLEGEHWTKDENGNTIVDESEKTQQETNFTHMWQWLGRSDYFYCINKFSNAKDAIDFGWNMKRIDVYNNDVVIPAEFNIDDLKSYISENLIAFFKGDRPLDEYDQFVQELYDIYDFGTYMEIAGEQLIEQGLATSIIERPAK